MPHLSIQTNVALTHENALDLAAKASALAAELLGKPQGFVQSLVMPGLALTHGGTAEPAAPAAFVQLKSIGLTQAQCPELSAALCAFLGRELAIPADRVYIDFVDLKRAWFGWDGKTFG